jgi:hypothetical protein
VNTDAESSARLYEDNEYPLPNTDSAITQTNRTCHPGKGKASAGIFYEDAFDQLL